MNRIHPTANAAPICALVVTMLVTGCRSTSNGVNTPFLAPDRVAPPSTRALAPGQAQPYYQGDPLPVMQSGATPPSNSLLTGDSAAARSSTGKTLAWNSPPAAQPAGTTAPTTLATSWPPTTQQTSTTAYGPEPAVSVPVDTASLRFPMQQTVQPSPESQIATGSPASTALPSSAATSSQSVMLASYNSPVSNPTAVTPSSPLGVPSAATSPWRSPQYSGVSPSSNSQQAALASPNYSQPIISPTPNYPMGQAPIAMPANAMAVSLRAVPSPAQPGDTMPRVRVPGYDDTPEMASADGFRPRASMR
jgi:hypothetical protein